MRGRRRSKKRKEEEIKKKEKVVVDQICQATQRGVNPAAGTETCGQGFWPRVSSKQMENNRLQINWCHGNNSPVKYHGEGL